MASHFEFIGNWLSKSQLGKQHQEMSPILWEFSFRGEQGVHSLIYNALYVMMISRRVPKQFLSRLKERKAGKDHKVPKADGSLHPLKLEWCTFKIFLRAYPVSKLISCWNWKLFFKICIALSDYFWTYYWVFCNFHLWKRYHFKLTKIFKRMMTYHDKFLKISPSQKGSCAIRDALSRKTR